MGAATIKLFLPFGDPRRLRTAEISNWSGKAVAAPRTDLDELLKREELQGAGVYVLTGTDPETGKTKAYVGEAEVIRDRIRQHSSKDFWVTALVFVSKDENLTKSHIRYLEGRIISEAKDIGRALMANSQASGARLPESDREDMDVFLSRIRQLLPILGSDILSPRASPKPQTSSKSVLLCEIKGLRASGKRTAEGFVVFSGSQAALKERPSARTRHAWVVSLRDRLLAEGQLERRPEYLLFREDVEFSSPSAAAAVVHGGGANGLVAWKTQEGRTLKSLESA